MSKTTVQTNETMWPEKIDAIYGQFPWLEQFADKACLVRAYVKKFDDTTLELQKLSHETDSDYPDLYRKHDNRIWFVNDSGTITCDMGITIEKRKEWVFWGKELIRERVGRNESVRSAVQKLDEKDSSTYLILFEKSILTIFKPPQKELTLKQWYDARVSAVQKQVAEEVAAV